MFFADFRNREQTTQRPALEKTITRTGNARTSKRNNYKNVTQVTNLAQNSGRISVEEAIGVRF